MFLELEFWNNTTRAAALGFVCVGCVLLGHAQQGERGRTVITRWLSYCRDDDEK